MNLKTGGFSAISESSKDCRDLIVISRDLIVQESFRSGLETDLAEDWASLCHWLVGQGHGGAAWQRVRAEVARVSMTGGVTGAARENPQKGGLLPCGGFEPAPFRACQGNEATGLFCGL